MTVVGGPQRFVLVDGCLRWQALVRLGRDTSRVEVWAGTVAATLMQVLARRQGRSFEPIEQAWLLAAAMAEGLSQRALATALGRDASWVSRRLALLSQLGEGLQEAVREDVLVSRATSRVLVPLACANSADASTMRRVHSVTPAKSGIHHRTRADGTLQKSPAHGNRRIHTVALQRGPGGNVSGRRMLSDLDRPTRAGRRVRDAARRRAIRHWSFRRRSTEQIRQPLAVA